MMSSLAKEVTAFSINNFNGTTCVGMLAQLVTHPMKFKMFISPGDDIE